MYVVLLSFSVVLWVSECVWLGDDVMIVMC